MATSRPQIAFLAAALVLLVLPAVSLLGFTALGIITQTEIASRLGPMLGVSTTTAFTLLFVAWLVLVLALVIALVVRLVRTTRV